MSFKSEKLTFLKDEFVFNLIDGSKNGFVSSMENIFIAAVKVLVEGAIDLIVGAVEVLVLP